MLKFFLWSLCHSAHSLLVSAAPTSLPFLHSSPPIWLSFCCLFHLSSYLKLCSRSGRYCSLSPVPSGYNKSPDTRFSRGMTRLMSLPDWECYLRPLQSLVVSLLLYLVSTLIFFRTGGVQPHRTSSTHRFLDFYRGTCASSSGLLCPLSSTLQRTHPSVRFLSL